MLNRLNADGHDESQYLPRGTPPVNAFRERKGGVVLQGTAIKALAWFPDILFNRRIIEKEHLDTCVSFFKALVETQRELGIGDIRGILADRSEDGEQKHRDTFFAVMHALRKPEANMLLWTICDDRNRGNIPLACHLIGTIKHALENTQIIIDNLSGTGKQEASAHPNCL